MGKKRKVRWIVGATVVAVALFTLVASVLWQNSPDKRMDAKLEELIAEYGFDRFEPEVLADLWWDENDYYVTPALSSHEIDKILEELGRECSGCTSSSSPTGVGDGLVRRFETGPNFASLTVVGLVDDDRTLYSSTEPGRFSVIIVGRLKDVPLLDRIKSWLHW